MTTDGAPIDLSKDQRDDLGEHFRSWISRVEDNRRERMKKTWIQALDNWEGKVPTKNWPWPGASNAHLPVTGTHTNAIKARIAEAATAQDPVYLVKPQAGGMVLDVDGMQVSRELWARWWQNISKAKEKDLRHKALQQENALVATTYGDSWVYITWKKEEVNDARLGDDGKVEFTPRVIREGPELSVIHGKDIYIEYDERDVQSARTVGLGFDLDLPTLREFKARGIYDKDIAEELEKRLSSMRDEDRLAEDMKIVTPNEWGDSDEFDQEMDRRVGVERSSNSLRMVRVWSRVDINGDGIPEDVVFEVEKETGKVPYARYSDLWHHQKPLEQFSYDKRPGSIFNRGVPELLFNLQKILDTTIRDHLDNNKVNNTKMFLARKGSPIEEKAKVYPSRIFWVDDVKTDFVPVDLGSGRSVTQIADIGLLERHAQFITGLSDQNLGHEDNSRTPATTTLALIEEGKKVLSEIIDVWRESQQRMWRQVLMLYLQYGDPIELAKLALTTSGGPETTEEVLAGISPKEEEQLFIAAFTQADPNEFFNQISISAEVSTNALNRSVQRQEALALDAQFDSFVQKTLTIANLAGGAASDPHLRALLLQFAKGYQRSMSRVLDTMDVKDQEVYAPMQLIEFIKGVQTVPAAPGGGGQQGSSPGQQAASMAGRPPGSTNEGESPGRPVAGGPRAPGELVSVDS